MYNKIGKVEQSDLELRWSTWVLQFVLDKSSTQSVGVSVVESLMMSVNLGSFRDSKYVVETLLACFFHSAMAALLMAATGTFVLPPCYWPVITSTLQ